MARGSVGGHEGSGRCKRQRSPSHWGGTSSEYFGDRAVAENRVTIARSDAATSRHDMEAGLWHRFMVQRIEVMVPRWTAVQRFQRPGTQTRRSRKEVSTDSILAQTRVSELLSTSMGDITPKSMSM